MRIAGVTPSSIDIIMKSFCHPELLSVQWIHSASLTDRLLCLKAANNNKIISAFAQLSYFYGTHNTQTVSKPLFTAAMRW